MKEMGTMVRFPILERAHIPMKAKNHVWNQLTFSETSKNVFKGSMKSKREANAQFFEGFPLFIFISLGFSMIKIATEGRWNRS